MGGLESEVAMEHYERYMLFEFYTFYPSGGLHDCDVSFANLDDAIQAFEFSNADHAQLFDRIDGIIIKER